MAQNKHSILNKSTEDLLKEIESLDEDDNETFAVDLNDSSVLTFLVKYKIEPGNFEVAKNLLYLLYQKSVHFPVKQHSFKVTLNHTFNKNNKSYFINTNLNSLVAKFEQDIKIKRRKSVATSRLDLKRFDKFIESHGLSNGKTLYISNLVLFYFYDKWTYENKYPHLHLLKFKQLANIYFTNTKQLTNGAHYGLDKTKFYEKNNKEEVKKGKDWAKKNRNKTTKKTISGLKS